MEKNRVPSDNIIELRRQAEEHLKTERQKIPELSASHDEMQRIIHELAVHQIELEMQQEELLQSRGELEEGLERFTELYDFAPLGYFTLARDGTILQVNLTGTKLLNVERSLLVGDRFGTFVADEDRSGFNTLLDRVFSSHDHLSQEVMLRNDENFQSQADDSLFRHKELVHNRMVRIDVVVSNDGQECMVVLSDITMQKHVEKENAALQSSLVQVRKMESIGRLAAGVAHDFNNMLQVMLGNIDLLIIAEGVSSIVREQLVELRMFVLKSAGLPFQLLVFARKQTIEPSVLDFNTTVGEMLNMLRRLIGEDINLVFTPGKDLWPVRMDPSQLDQIMINLALNSRDAIQGAGTLVIETSNVVVDASYSLSHSESLPGEYVQLVVRDDGRGIDKEIINSIFEPFFSTKPMSESCGFGLATVYGIVRQNDGFIEVFSKDKEGTTFEIYLPRCIIDEASGRLPERKQIDVPGGEETILLVEDDDAVREITVGFLKSFGYHVLEARSPAEALTLSADYSDSIQLLVTDMIMPGMNGWDLSLAIIKSRPELKRLFISGYAADIFEHNGIQDASVPFLGKPFSRFDLACNVREVLDMDSFSDA
jgi:two-component system cell cycle sensor histidine kinase/response regulator CckA